MRKTILGLVLGLAVLPRAGAAYDWLENDAKNYVQPAPEPPRAFWYGGDMPLTYTAQTPNGPMVLPLGTAINDFLTKPNPYTKVPSPLTLLSGWMFAYDNSKGQAGVTIPDTGRAFHGYTLLTVLNGYKVPGDDTVYNATLVDMNGQIVKKWPLFGFPVKMLPNGDIIGGNGPGLESHQEQGAIIQMDWCGKEVWKWLGPDPANAATNGGARSHHDHQRQGNPVGYYAPGQDAMTRGGKTLILAHENPPIEDTLAVSDKFYTEEDVIYEVDEAGKVLWSWHPYKVIDQMGFSPIAREAIRTQPVGAPENIGGGFVQTDWQHINSASYLGPNKWYDAGDKRFHPDNIIWDGRSSNVIAIVARHDDPAGKWKSGDIVWRIGPDFGPGTPEHEIGQIIGQHHAHLVPRGLPGAGNILVFDNGGLAGFGNLFPGLPAFWPVTYRTHSRVLEIDPITLKIVWEYTNTQDNERGRQFFSWYISSAQRLPNGNTLITEGANGRIFEVTRKGEIVWEYIWPKAMSEGSGTGFGNAVYRAYRVPPQWIPKNPQCP